MRAVLLSLAGLTALAAIESAAAAETIRFAIMRDGQPIGSNTIELQRNGAETTVRMITRIQVKIALMTVYRFDQTETERWVDGRLVGLESATDDNGTPHRVTATSSNGKITVNADGKVSQIAGTTIPASYWNPALLGKSVALNPQDGAIVPVAVTDRGEDHVVVQGRAKRARHYVIRTTFPQASDGSTIRYQPAG